jgi:hypothetical protein
LLSRSDVVSQRNGQHRAQSSRFVDVNCHSSNPTSHHLEPLPLLRYIHLLQVPRILIAQLKVHILHRLVDPLLTADANDRAHALLNTPSRSYTRHTDAIPLRHLLDPLNNLLVHGKLALVYERVRKLVRPGALGGAISPRAREGAARDGGPGDEADAGVFAVRDLWDAVSDEEVGS